MAKRKSGFKAEWVNDTKSGGKPSGTYWSGDEAGGTKSKEIDWSKVPPEIITEYVKWGKIPPLPGGASHARAIAKALEGMDVSDATAIAKAIRMNNEKEGQRLKTKLSIIFGEIRKRRRVKIRGVVLGKAPAARRKR